MTFRSVRVKINVTVMSYLCAKKRREDDVQDALWSKHNRTAVRMDAKDDNEIL